MQDEPTRRRVIVAITGATGAVFGVRTLQRLQEFDVETHLVVSGWGMRTLAHETSLGPDDLKGIADFVYRPGDQGAAISSGSFRTAGMIVAPCSVKTVAAIASGYASDLIPRAADVVLKERRSLVLLVRESPLSEIHLDNMLKLSRMGVSIVPPVPAFYNHPSSIAELIDHVVTRALDQLGLESYSTPRWDGRMGQQRVADASQ